MILPRGIDKQTKQNHFISNSRFRDVDQWEADWSTATVYNGELAVIHSRVYILAIVDSQVVLQS